MLLCLYNNIVPIERSDRKMIPRLSSNDLQFWETMYSSGVPVASSRGGLGIAYLERIGSAVTFEKNQILFRYDEIPDRFYVVKSGLVV